MGAITHKSMSFRARPWELKSFLYKDVNDCHFSAIRIDCRTQEIIRVHSALKFLNNKSRYIYLNLNYNRSFSNIWQISNGINLGWYKVIKIFEFVQNTCRENSLKYIFSFISKVINIQDGTTRTKIKFNVIADNIVSLNALNDLNEFSHSEFGYFSVIDTMENRFSIYEQNQLETLEHTETKFFHAFPRHAHVLYLSSLRRIIKMLGYPSL